MTEPVAVAAAPAEAKAPLHSGRGGGGSGAEAASPPDPFPGGPFDGIGFSTVAIPSVVPLTKVPGPRQTFPPSASDRIHLSPAALPATPFPVDFAWRFG